MNQTSSTATAILKKPVEHAGVTYSEFTFRELLTGDVAVADSQDGDFNKTLAMLASMAGVPLPVMKKLTMADFKQISECAAPLMGEFAEVAGSTSSS